MALGSMQDILQAAMERERMARGEKTNAINSMFESGNNLINTMGSLGTGLYKKQQDALNNTRLDKEASANATYRQSMLDKETARYRQEGLDKNDKNARDNLILATEYWDSYVRPAIIGTKPAGLPNPTVDGVPAYEKALIDWYNTDVINRPENLKNGAPLFKKATSVAEVNNYIGEKNKKIYDSLTNNLQIPGLKQQLDIFYSTFKANGYSDAEIATAENAALTAQKEKDRLAAEEAARQAGLKKPADSTIQQPTQLPKKTPESSNNLWSDQIANYNEIKRVLALNPLTETLLKKKYPDYFKTLKKAFSDNTPDDNGVEPFQATEAIKNLQTIIDNSNLLR